MSQLELEVNKRFRSLREMTEEEGERINPESIRGLLTFLERNPKGRVPELSLTPSGNILAEWREGPAGLVVEFLPAGESRFVLRASGLFNPEEGAENLRHCLRLAVDLLEFSPCLRRRSDAVRILNGEEE